MTLFQVLRARVYHFQVALFLIGVAPLEVDADLFEGLDYVGFN